MTVMLAAERTAAPVQQQAGSLAIRPEQTMWTPEQAAVLRQSGISDDVTNAELAGFLHLCQRTGLDPFSRQIYLIGRKDRKAGRVVFTPQTGIDGYRVIAQRVTAQTGGTYGYEDFLWCDSAGRWRDVWLSEQPPAAAKVTVVRNGQKFSAVATFREYVQTFPDGNPVGLWAKMPAGQIAKCCEALALRKAFPHDLAGVYTAEEMAQADNPQPGVYHVIDKQAPAQDQWEQATPAPVQQTPPDVVAAEPESPQQDGDLSPEARQYLADAEGAETPAAFRVVREAAERAGAPAPFLARLDGIAAAKWPAPDPTPSTAGSGTTAAPATAPATASPTPDPLPGSPDDPKARGLAMADMLAAGAAVGVSAPEVRGEFQRRFGHSTDTATIAELLEIEADLKAAGGAQ